MPRVRDLPALLLLTGLLTMGTVAAADAQTFTVTRTDDPVPGACKPADCSLREALTASNKSTMLDDVVVVPAASSHYAIDLGQLEITDGVDVKGAAADRVVLDAGGKSIALRVEGPVLLEGLTITGGQGGIQNGGELTLRRVAIEHNDRIDGGGGGIQSNGPLSVEESFIGFNTTNAISGSAIQSNDPVTIVNSTLASNESLGPAVQGNAGLTISSSAIVFNTRLESGEAAGIRGNPPTTLTDSIVAANHTPDGTENCQAGLVTSQGGNVEDDATCSPEPSDRANTAPGLGALALHGGPTSVYELLPSSPAVDFALSCPPTDQRGVSRPQGAACDSGPFELEPAPPPAAAAKDETVSLVIGRGKVRIDHRGKGRISLTCPATEQTPPCRGTLRLKTARAVRFHGHSSKLSLAKARFSISAGATKRVVLNLGPEKADLIGAEAVARKELAVAQVSDAAGNHAVVKRGLAARLKGKG